MFKRIILALVLSACTGPAVLAADAAYPSKPISFIGLFRRAGARMRSRVS